LRCGNSDVPYPLSRGGNGPHGPHLVGLPSCGVLSDQSGIYDGGDGWRGAGAADRLNAQLICDRSGWWLW
jgi:hypothetical protein